MAAETPSLAQNTATVSCESPNRLSRSVHSRTFAAFDLRIMVTLLFKEFVRIPQTTGPSNNGAGAAAYAHPDRIRVFRQVERRDRVDRRQTARAKRRARKKLLDRRRAKK